MDYEIVIRFLLAALWGGIVGSEREYHSKSAGFRTMIMISVGSCFFTMMSVWIGGTGTPDRIAANIVTGIGFLGAGVIFRGENRINGITTAATIWAVAAVGMGIGQGFYLASASASILILLVLAVLPYFEKMIDQLNQMKLYSVQCQFATDAKERIETLLKQHKLRSKFTKHIKEGNQLSLNWQAHGHVKNQALFIKAMLEQDFIYRFEYE